MFKKLVSIFIIIISTAAFANARGIDLRPDQVATINSISSYLKSLKTFNGDFIQIAPNGQRSNGKFWIRRPGLMRFEYAPPTKLLIIADRVWVGVVDLKVKKKADRYPLSETPLDFILSDDPDILRKTDIQDFYYEPGNLSITMTDKNKTMKGSLTLLFAGDDLHLSSWTITDEHGRQTSIHMTNLVENGPVSGKNFALHKY